jgi:hypothetical protein
MHGSRIPTRKQKGKPALSRGNLMEGHDQLNMHLVCIEEVDFVPAILILTSL